MSRYMKAFLFIILFSVLNFACTQQTSLPGAENLIGSWQWVQTSGGLSYHVDTPLSTGKTVSLTITNDGHYSINTNNILTTQGTFTITSQKSIYENTNKIFLNFSASEGMMVEYCNNTNLTLSDNCDDGFVYEYVRK